MHHESDSTSAAWGEQLERLSASLDGALGPEEHATLAAHLATCAMCQQALAELRETRALLRALPLPTPPRAFTLPFAEEPAATAPSTAPVPLTRRTPHGTRWARVVQAVGGLAATLGLFGLLSGLAPGMGSTLSRTAAPASGASSAALAQPTPTPTHAAPGRLAPYDRNGASTPSPTATAQAAQEPPPAPPLPVPLAGGALFAGGLLLVAGGQVAIVRARRRR